MIVLNVTYHCKEGLREAFLSEIKAEGIDAACRGENGNIMYDYFYAADDRNVLLLVEKWQDADALSAHSAQPHFVKLGELKSKYVVNTDIDKFAF